MKICPICLDAPAWHYCRNVSAREKEDKFIFASCRHGKAIGDRAAFVATAERAAVESEWDEVVVLLFDSYTQNWTEEERVAFRANIWPNPETIPYVARPEIREEDERPF